MATVIERPTQTAYPEERIDSDPEFAGQLLAFDFLEYQAGTKLARLKDIQTENLNILAEGCIKVIVQCSLGESTIHVFNPGDMLKLESIENFSTLDEGTPSHIQTVFLADANAKIYSLKQKEVGRIFDSEPKLTCKLIQDMKGRWYEALQKMTAQCNEIRNYIYSGSARLEMPS